MQSDNEHNQSDFQTFGFTIYFNYFWEAGKSETTEILPQQNIEAGNLYNKKS